MASLHRHRVRRTVVVTVDAARRRHAAACMARVAAAARLPGVEVVPRQAAPDKTEPASLAGETGSYAPPTARERSLR